MSIFFNISRWFLPLPVFYTYLYVCTLWLIRQSWPDHQITKLKCFSSRLSVVFAQSIEARFDIKNEDVFEQSIEARCYIENEDVFEAAPTGDAPATSEWLTIWLPTKVQFILEVLR